VIVTDGSPEPPWHRLSYVPSTWPGSRPPVVWLGDNDGGWDAPLAGTSTHPRFGVSSSFADDSSFASSPSPPPPPPPRHPRRHSTCLILAGFPFSGSTIQSMPAPSSLQLLSVGCLSSLSTCCPPGPPLMAAAGVCVINLASAV
jgi:hypothetical protein